VGLAVAVNEVCDIGHVDRFGATTARDEEIRLDPEVEVVAEIRAVWDDLAGGEAHILLVDQDAVALGTELLGVEAGDGRTGLGEADELGSVESCGIVEDTGTVNDGDRLVLAEQDLVYTVSLAFYTKVRMS
jgi:hypothetical protein